MNWIERIHDRYVHTRRTRVLTREISALLPQNASVLDVGCGDGLLDTLILKERPDLKISGLDTLVREKTHIPVTRFDGKKIPHADKSFDVILFVDVLHHTPNLEELLSEAVRVGRLSVVIKDHLCEGRLDHWTLRFMDAVGNARYGVPIPGEYLSKRKWVQTFARLGLEKVVFKENIRLYPTPASFIFRSALQFTAKADL